MWLSRQNNGDDPDFDRLQSLPVEEQQVINRWVVRRAARSWRFWVAISFVSLTMFFSHFGAQIVRGAGGGPLAEAAVWIAFHIAYGAVLTRVLPPIYRRALHELLAALDEREQLKSESPPASGRGEAA